MPLMPRRPTDRSLLRGLIALYLGLATVLAACGAMFGGYNAFVGAVGAVSAVISFGLLVTTLCACSPGCCTGTPCSGRIADPRCNRRSRGWRFFAPAHGTDSASIFVRRVAP
jgi:hypothetical protein